MGLAVREAFSFWTGNPYDFEVLLRTGAVVAQGSNPYHFFWPPVAGASFAFLGQDLPSAAYPPFWAVLAGILFRGWATFGGGNRFLLYFLLKQPQILADVATSYLLYRLVLDWSGDPQTARRALTFWSFFPYAIVISAIWGQLDPIVVALLVGILWSRSTLRRTILEGWGIFVKWVTVIFVPLEFFRERGRRRLLCLVALAVPVLATLFVFTAAGWSLFFFQNTAASENLGGGTGMNFLRLASLAPVAAYLATAPGLTELLSLLWVPAVVVAGWAAARWTGPGGSSGELRALLFVTAVFLCVRWGLNEQYLLYAFALLVVDVLVFHPERRPLLYLLALLTSMFLVLNNNLGLFFLAPVDPGALTYVLSADARTYLLLGVALLVAVTLAQLAYVVYRDQAAPTVWPVVLARRSRAWGRRARSAAGRAVALPPPGAP